MVHGWGARQQGGWERVGNRMRWPGGGHPSGVRGRGMPEQTGDGMEMVHRRLVGGA